MWQPLCTGRKKTVESENNFDPTLKRKKDEEELDALKQQIEKRKDVRQKQIEERAERERERAERAKVVDYDSFENESKL